MRRHVAMLAVLVMVGLSAGAASARPMHGADQGRHMGWQGGPGSMRAMLRAADLTDEQRVQVRQILETHRPAFRQLRADLRVARAALTDRLYAGGAVTPDELAPLTGQIEQLRTQLAQAQLQTMLEVRALLTPEQLAKAAQARQERRERMQQRQKPPATQ